MALGHEQWSADHTGRSVEGGWSEPKPNNSNLTKFESRHPAFRFGFFSILIILLSLIKTARQLWGDLKTFHSPIPGVGTRTLVAGRLQVQHVMPSMERQAVPVVTPCTPQVFF